jgi:hypothetical protein
LNNFFTGGSLWWLIEEPGFKLGLLALSLILIVPILSACGSGTSSPTSSKSYTTIAVTATAETEIYNNGNLSGVENNPTYDTTFDITDSYEVTLITDYHWNNGQGAKGGTIGWKTATAMKSEHGRSP